MCVVKYHVYVHRRRGNVDGGPTGVSTEENSEEETVRIQGLGTESG